jgi:hypothetical protein
MSTEDGLLALIEGRNDYQANLAVIERANPEGAGLTSSFDEVFPDHIHTVENFARTWVREKFSKSVVYMPLKRKLVVSLYFLTRFTFHPISTSCQFCVVNTHFC